MSKIKEAIIEVVMPIVKAAGKAEMEVVLSEIKEHNNIDVYRNTLKSLYSNFSLLKEVAVKSKTKIDDGVVDLMLEAVTEKAKEDEIVLTN